MGDTTALDASESAVVEVIFLLRKGLLAAGRLETVEEAMLLDLGEIGWPGKEDRVGSKTARVWGPVSTGAIIWDWKWREAQILTYPSRETSIDLERRELDSKRGGPREGKESWKLFPLVQGPEIFVVGAAFRGSIIRDLLGLPQLVSCRTGPGAPPLG